MWTEEGQRQGEDRGTLEWRAEWVLGQEGLPGLQQRGEAVG